MPCPPPPALQALVARILERSDSFQGRVAARGQIQIALDFPQNAQWVALFKAWWREGFVSWRARHLSDENLVFLCELGPPDYAITGADVASYPIAGQNPSHCRNGHERCGRKLVLKIEISSDSG